jgi:hypothetical protein
MAPRLLFLCSPGGEIPRRSNEEAEMLERLRPSGLLRLAAVITLGASLLLSGCAASTHEATQTAVEDGWPLRSRSTRHADPPVLEALVGSCCAPAPAEAGVGGLALRAELDALRRRHAVVLEGEAARTLADPSLRVAEVLVDAAVECERERAATGRVSAARDEAERRLAGRERDEAGHLARDYWATAERLLAR